MSDVYCPQSIAESSCKAQGRAHKSDVVQTDKNMTNKYNDRLYQHMENLVFDRETANA